MRKEIKKAILYIFILLLIDIISKQLAIYFLTPGDKVIIPNFFYLKLIFNTGSAFSMFEGARWLFVGATVVILIYAWKYYLEYSIQSKWFYYGGILFFAGTIGNFIDRLFVGKVTDFFSFVFGNYHFAIFNIADALLSISVPILLIGYYLFEKQLEKEEQKNEE